MELLNNNNNRIKTSQPYYYIWAIVNGRLYVDGAYSNYNDALKFGANKIKVYFEVTELPTKDLSVATQAIKHKYLEKTGDIEQATKRAKHQVKE
jgi:hypothetical protein